MFCITNFFTLLLLTLAVFIEAASSIQKAQFNREICQYESLVCNNSDLVQKCGAYKFCRTRSMACDTIQTLETGFRHVFPEVIQYLHAVCDDNYKPFKKMYDLPGPSKMELGVQAGQLPFTLTFDFAGDSQSPSAKGHVKIDIDKKEIYNDLNDDINAAPDKK